MTRAINGYAIDIPYLRDFKPMLAPAWLDHVALVGGVEPPDRQDGFAWCDLGCGQGVTAVTLAATHPNGAFHGVDAMAVHIDHARRLAAEAAIPNVAFHAIDFATEIDLELRQFDYIVAHGVYTWVDRETQSALRRFIDLRLKPGGLVYVSYNAMPGWARDLPFQRLTHELGRTSVGDSAVRFAAAAEIIRALAEARVPALAASFTVRELEQRPQDYTPAYLVHEFMPAAWQPLYVTEVRAAMAAIGLTPVGSATLSENFDWMVLDEDAQKTLTAITDEDVRELVRDFYLDQRFRCDVFARGNRRLGPDERARRLYSSTFALARPVPAIHYTTTTPAGSFAYDNPISRAIVSALAAGPRALTGLVQNPAPAGDLLRNILTLCAAGEILPAEPGSAAVNALNRALWGRLDGPEEIRWLALPCGTASEVDRDLIRLLRDGEEISDDRFPGWREFLASHGL
jgi:ubiquinone/menaquinone biosynthesis C-methylase UbiE